MLQHSSVRQLVHRTAPAEARGGGGGGKDDDEEEDDDDEEDEEDDEDSGVEDSGVDGGDGRKLAPGKACANRSGDGDTDRSPRVFVSSCDGCDGGPSTSPLRCSDPVVAAVPAIVSDHRTAGLLTRTGAPPCGPEMRPSERQKKTRSLSIAR